MRKNNIRLRFFITGLITILIFCFLFSCGGNDSDNSPKEDENIHAEMVDSNRDNKRNPPEIESISHPNGSIISQNQKLIFKLSENSIGINPSSLTVSVDGADILSIASFIGNQIILTPTQQMNWPNCDIKIKLSISNKKGETLAVEYNYVVHPCAKIIALPATGKAPLKIRFSPDIITGNAIQAYEWDFDGDDQYDKRDVVGGNQAYTYKTSGVYAVSLKIIDAEENSTIATTKIQVENSPTEVNAQAIPSNGSVPLKVKFKIKAVDNEGIAKYEWDFDGDGIYDYSSAKTGSIVHIYPDAGTYQPALRITDNSGSSLIFSEQATRIIAGNTGTPTVKLTARKPVGEVPLKVDFKAGVARSAGPIKKWEWDFNGDGRFDETITDSDKITYTYLIAGDYNARVRVTKADGIASEDIIKVIVQPSLSLELSTDTIDTNNEEFVTITTRLSGETQVSLVIEDQDASVIKNLVPWTTRSPGTYNDEWTGDDNEGNMVAQGSYNAILLYKLNGEEKRFDLALTTGGVQSNPPRSDIPPILSPYAGKPLNIDFKLDHASQVTAFIGRYKVDQRQITFMQRTPLGRGSHRITWDGANSQGQVVNLPNNDSYIFGIFAYTLPDNSVYVRSGSHVSALSISPSIFNPSEHAKNGEPVLSTLSFELSGPANIELVVSGADTGGKIFRKIVSNLPEGSNAITWDGKTENGILAAPGKYRLGIRAIDDQGHRSMALYILQRIYY